MSHCFPRLKPIGKLRRISLVALQEFIERAESESEEVAQSS
jgi:hypothetical protein